MKKLIAATFLATLTGTALATNWVTQRDDTGMRVGVDTDTFRRYVGANTGAVYLQAWTTLNGGTDLDQISIDAADCRRGYGQVFIGPEPLVWNFELNGNSNGDFFANVLCSEGKRRGAY